MRTPYYHAEKKSHKMQKKTLKNHPQNSKKYSAVKHCVSEQYIITNNLVT